MILQSLAEYYERADDLAPEGWERRRIPFIIELQRDGTFVQLTSLQSGKKAADTKPSLVPKAEIRSGSKSYEKPNSLWDHIGFVLGHPKSESDHDRSTAERQFEAFRCRVLSLAERLPSSVGLRAVGMFYEGGEFRRVFKDPLWPECLKIAGCNVTFRLVDEGDLIVHEPGVRDLLAQSDAGTDAGTCAVCMVTGELQPIQKLHFPIAGVCEKPAPLLSINNGANPSFASFGKEQGFNSPVGRMAAFRYSTALNHLLRPGSRQRIRVGDASTVFWAQVQDEVEDVFAQVFGETDDPDARTGQIRALFEAIHSGKFDGGRGENNFYVLGLAPNAARIAVRFWHAAPVAKIAQRIRAWFDDLAVMRGPNDAEYPSLFRLLAAVSVQGKADNIPPNLGGDVMRSILTGGSFPAMWLNAAVQRCRAERRVTYLRGAAIKACLNRSIRRNDNEKEFQPMLDPSNTNTAYRLGRLFAVLEKIQEEASPGLNATIRDCASRLKPKAAMTEASPGLNATIRDRYYGAASTTPVTVFTSLLRLKNAHLKKLSNGRIVWFEKQLGEVLGEIDDFPAHLMLPDQGRFALGYYHQRQAFFTKNTSEPAATTEGN